MMIFLYIILSFNPSVDPTKIARINEIKENAEVAYLEGDYEKSVELYTVLADSFNIADEDITLNLAHSYFKLHKQEKSTEYYQKLQHSLDKKIKSIAYQQLGVLSRDPKNLNKALAYLKESIRANPANQEARYNYELVKKWKNEQEKEEKENKQNSGNNREPSEYAKRLKEQADRLVLKNEYAKAHDLLQSGLEIDETVSYYNDFIKRTKEVVEIDN